MVSQQSVGSIVALLGETALQCLLLCMVGCTFYIVSLRSWVTGDCWCFLASKMPSSKALSKHLPQDLVAPKFYQTSPQSTNAPIESLIGTHLGVHC